MKVNVFLMRHAKVDGAAASMAILMSVLRLNIIVRRFMLY
ncbi:hypothetical protein JCM19240_3600 [Vibrio maritimus]|uniref:Uncharacterized protein n=1 Tax=Vibrio maritimus TaxID=990268 RepID=A0A090T5H2_9VIBR|nr:hypothetical protein JCM19240_3600 [Vibrio maritimus]